MSEEFDSEVVIVSGLPRSGTSLMMKMLEAGGMQILTDHIRTADEDNPKGYYEFERAKKLRDGDTAWVADARGKVVKVISALLKHLPPGINYRVVFMQRALSEVIASQEQMIIRRKSNSGGAAKPSHEEMIQIYQKHLAEISSWLEKQENFEVLYVSYNQLVSTPGILVPQVNGFFGGKLDSPAMAAAIDASLYRQRKS